MSGNAAMERLTQAVAAAERYASEVRGSVRARVAAASLDAEQRAAHGYAWVETSAAAMRATLDWLQAADAEGRAGQQEWLTATIGIGETLAQLTGGLPMGQNEIVRPVDLDSSEAARRLAAEPAVDWLLSNGNSAANRAALVACMAGGQPLDDRLGDELIDTIREQYRRFTDDRILPHAHGWHLANDLIPDALVAEMAALGTFGVCIPEAFGGLGLGKLVMCVVTEELSRGYIGTGSLGTRSEIAGELILHGGTKAQQAQWLPRIASGEVLPTAVFTEPDVGSDLGSLSTRAVRGPDGTWSISGAKTWITHAARSDLMTMLVRTRPEVKGYAGLSMLLVPKPRGSEGAPFPAPGMSGSEIEVLGYRGMREASSS